MSVEATQIRMIRATVFDRWVDAIRYQIPSLEMSRSSTAPFRGALQLRSCGSASVAVIATDESCITRTPAQARAADTGLFKIMWQLKGTGEVEQQGMTGRLGPGCLTVTDTMRPYRMSFSDHSQLLVLYLAWGVHPEWRGVVDRNLGCTFAADVATRSALAALLTVVRATPDTAGQCVIDAVSDMLLMSISSRRCTESKDVMRQQHRLREARQYVLRNLEDPQLCVERLAEALGVSRRSLYSIFQPLGTTPAEFIRSMRLERCKAALTDHAQRARTLTEIATQYGFADSAHFSRAFRSQFGVRPSEWRSKAA
jgi:AraC-like DNA-binding protein